MVIRRFFGLFALLMCMSLTVQAQDYPSKAIQLIVPNGPGGGTDTFGRVIAQRLSERLNQKVIVDNKPGAQAGIGTAFGARAAPDGYTLTVALTSSVAITPFLIPNIEYDPINDFVAVAIGVDQPFVVVTSISRRCAATIANRLSIACRTACIICITFHAIVGCTSIWTL